MTTFRIMCIVSASVLVGCSAPKGKGTLYKQKTRVLRSLPTERELLRTEYRMRVDAFPSERSPFLTLRLERLDKYVIISKKEVVTIGTWRREKDGADLFIENPVGTTIAGILYPLATSFGGEFIYKDLGWVYTEEVMPNTRRIEEDRSTEYKASAVSDALAEIEGLGTSRTNANGVLRCRAKPESFSAGVKIVCKEYALAYELKSARRTCRGSSELLELYRTGSTAFSVFSKIRLFFRYTLGRITPISFVVSLVMDIVTGVIIDYIVESLIVKCSKCGHQWEMNDIRGTEIDATCPKCGNHSRFHVHVD